MSGLIVDGFAGGGGASTGIELALGFGPDIAINHDEEALAMHERNHPLALHYHEDIWKVGPLDVTYGRPVRFAWFSPDCRHFSRAKGGKPVSRGIRSLPWVVWKWARDVGPDCIVVENVEEMSTWGPVDDNGIPRAGQEGKTFKRWLHGLRRAGYVVEKRKLRACDFGAPTTRERLFIIARRDGLPIVWPTPTHGPGRAHPWRVAGDVIDWTEPMLSIFATHDEAVEWARVHGRGVPRRPLADNTLARIGEGLRRFVVGTANPFIVGIDHASAGKSAVWSAEQPLRTATTENRFAVAAPLLIQTGYGERPGQTPRALDLFEPLGTVVAGGAKHALCAAFLAKHYTGVVGTSLSKAMGTVTTIDHHSLVRAFLVKFYGTSNAANLQLPLDTVTTRDRFGLVTINGEDYAIADIAMRMLTPRELFRAQGFPDTYDLCGDLLSTSSQVRMAGNSVCPPLARAITKACLVDAVAVAEGKKAA